MKQAALVSGVLALVGIVQLVVAPGPTWIPLAAAAGVLTLAWAISLPLKNAGIIDILWGPVIALIGWVAVCSYERALSIPLVIALAMVTLWAARLGIHLALRNVGAEEDFRYAKFRKEAGGRFWIQSLFSIFWLQAALAWVVAAPLIGVAIDPDPKTPGIFQALGFALWLAGLAFEWVADAQLRRFKADPDNQGKVLDTGLWGLTRHPNYFGEAVLWWGIYLYSAGLGGALYVIGPVLITFMLMRFSGVAMLEEGMSERRPAYAEYVRNTPAFFPRWRSS